MLAPAFVLTTARPSTSGGWEVAGDLQSPEQRLVGGMPRPHDDPTLRHRRAQGRGERPGSRQVAVEHVVDQLRRDRLEHGVACRVVGDLGVLVAQQVLHGVARRQPNRPVRSLDLHRTGQLEEAGDGFDVDGDGAVDLAPAGRRVELGEHLGDAREVG